MSDDINQAQTAAAPEGQGVAANSTLPTAAPTGSVAPSEGATTGTVPTPQLAEQPTDVQAPATPAEAVPTTPPTDVVPTTPAEQTPPAAPQEQQPATPPIETPSATPEVPATPEAPAEPLPEFAQANPAREEVPEMIEVEERVVYGGQHVSTVLRDGRELRTPDGMKITHYHCNLADGTTAHVPVELFRK